TYLAEILQKHEARILQEWLATQTRDSPRSVSAGEERRAANDSREFLTALRESLQNGQQQSIHSSEWSRVREFLTGLSESRAKAGFSPSETATFVFSLK